MSVYLEMAMRLKQEIATAEEHLSNLKAALAALQPLVTVDAEVNTVRILAFDASRMGPADIADAEEVEVDAGTDAVADFADHAARKPRGTAVRRGRAASPQSKARAPRQAAPGSLPATGREFWIGLMGKRKHTLQDIVEKAIRKLDVQEDVRPILANRLSAWLYPALKAGQLQQAGSRGKLKLYQVVS